MSRRHRQTADRRRARRRAFLNRFRYALLSGIAVAVVAVALCSWLGVRALEARSHLVAAENRLLTLETALKEGSLRPGDVAVSGAVAVAARHTRAAHRLTSDALWRLAARLPGGCPLRSSAALATAANELAANVAPPLTAMASALSPRRDATAIAVNVSSVRAASRDAVRARERAGELLADVSRISDCGTVGTAMGIGPARAEFAARLQRVDDMATDLQTAAELMPPMLGLDGPRRYLLVVQNDAESRATGGILAGYGILEASDGRLSLDTRNRETLPELGSKPVIRLSPEFEARYARLHYAQHWQNANVTPDYPMAGRIYAAMWKRATGQQIDGVVAIDPTMLGGLLSVAGPARMPDGQIVNGAGLVSLLESRIYWLLPTDRQRDVYFAAAGRAIFRAVLDSAAPPIRLLPALGRAADEGRLLIWSRRSAEEKALQGTPLSGALPTAAGPFLAVVNQNGAGGKLDYWLHRSTAYNLRRLLDGTGRAEITARFTNDAPASGLPDYVRLRIEDGAPRNPPQGQNVLFVSIYGGTGSGYVRATVDGRPVRMESEVERRHSVFSTYITLNPGQTRTLRLDLVEPRWQPFVTVRSQPLINVEKLTVTGAQRRDLKGNVAS